MRPQGEKIVLDDQRDLEIALVGARHARPLRGQALRELFAHEGNRPPHQISEYTSERVVNGLKRIALRGIVNPFIQPEAAEELLNNELGVSLEPHRI
jgi:hypothetical protein